MPEPFPILELPEDAASVDEQLGSKEKFWFRREGDKQPWLFKFTRENTGEDWSEKIASELARVLGVPAARVELARFLGRRGCASRSFVETHAGFDLIHGSEVLGGRVLGYDRAKVRGQCDHSMRNILAAVRETFPGKRERPAQLRTLAGFIVLDALIVNTDRHHDNWGLLRGPSERGRAVREIAPSFDHASSLGRELLDPARVQRLAQPGAVARYVSKAQGGIFWDGAGSRGENPLALATRAVTTYPDYFRPWLQGARRLPPEIFRDIVYRIPAVWMSEPAKDFCLALLTVTSERLKSL